MLRHCVCVPSCLSWNSIVHLKPRVQLLLSSLPFPLFFSEKNRSGDRNKEKTGEVSKQQTWDHYPHTHTHTHTHAPRACLPASVCVITHREDDARMNDPRKENLPRFHILSHILFHMLRWLTVHKHTHRHKRETRERGTREHLITRTFDHWNSW